MATKKLSKKEFNKKLEYYRKGGYILDQYPESKKKDELKKMLEIK
jgi:hypothetical protein